jgi:hypothetical protein
MVDECHAAGFIGATGKEPEAKVMGRVDIITGTLGIRRSYGRLYHGKKKKLSRS